MNIKIARRFIQFCMLFSKNSREVYSILYAVLFYIRKINYVCVLVVRAGCVCFGQVPIRSSGRAASVSSMHTLLEKSNKLNFFMKPRNVWTILTVHQVQTTVRPYKLGTYEIQYANNSQTGS